MLVINNIKFAKNDSQIVDSLFTKKTCYGYYEKTKNVIRLFDKQKNCFAAIVRNSSGFLGIVNCSKNDKGYFYQYGLSSNIESLLGVESYSKNIDAALKAFKVLEDV